MTSNLDKITKKEIEFEQNLIKEVLRDEYTRELKIVFEACQALIEVVRAFCQQFPNFDPKLNQHYTQLLKIIENSVNKVHSELDERMEKQLLPWSYTHAEIFDDLGYYKPFENLYTAEKELGKVDWNEIRKNMNNFLGKIGPILKEAKNRKSVKNPYSKTLKKIESYLKQIKQDNGSQKKNIRTGISYNSTSGHLNFNRKTISIPKDTYQDALCRVLLKDKKSMRKVWVWDEILDEWGGKYQYDDKQAWRKVYNAAREVNQKVATETATKDFLIVKTKEIAVNPKYL